jgi:uncharacterized protein
MKTSLFLSLLILIGCTASREFKTIILKTSGIVETAPDEASITISVTCVDMIIEQAKMCLIEKTEGLNDDLERYAIPKEDILTTQVNLTKDYIWRNNSNIFNGYRASTSMNVKIRDLKILEELYATLLTNEQLTIGALTYSHSKMDSISGLAYLKALENANTLADRILSQIPEKNKVIKQISNIRTERSEGSPGVFRKLEVAEMDQERLPVNTGNIVNEQQLYVEYEIY